LPVGGPLPALSSKTQGNPPLACQQRMSSRTFTALSVFRQVSESFDLLCSWMIGRYVQAPYVRCCGVSVDGWIWAESLRCGCSASSTILHGAILLVSPAPTTGACCTSCTNSGQCVGATYSVGLCTLFSNMTAVRFQANSTSFASGLPDVLMMQSFVAGFDSACRDATWTSATPICNWANITCNSAGRVVKFVPVDKGCIGTVALGFAPSSTQLLNLDGNQFSGPVDLTSLPSGMQGLALDSNQFSGSVDLTSLPSGMQGLYLDYNQFTGSVDLTSLPSGLQQQYLLSNQFTGSVNLRSLPSGMLGLALGSNQFSGPVDLRSKPSGMQYLSLFSTEICNATLSNIGCSPLDLPSDCSCSISGQYGIVQCPPCSARH